MSTEAVRHPHSSGNRLAWLDYSRGLILFMFFSHVMKRKSGPLVQDFLLNDSPWYFARFTLGFVGITGLGLVLLSDILSRNRSLYLECWFRGSRLMLVAMCLWFLQSGAGGFIASITGEEGALPLWAFLTLGESAWGAQSFILRIGLFVLFAPLIIPRRGELPWRALVAIAVFATVGHYLDNVQWSPHKGDFVLLNGYLLVGSLGIVMGQLTKERRVSFGLSTSLLCVITGLCIVAVSVVGPATGFELLLEWLPRMISVLCIGVLIDRIDGFALLKKNIALLGVYALFAYELHLGLLNVPLPELPVTNDLGDLLLRSALIIGMMVLAIIAVLHARVRLPAIDTRMKKALGI